jgi:hypothetical protein
MTQCADPRLRIRLKMSRIWNNAFRRSIKFKQYFMCCTIICALLVLKMFEYLACASMILPPISKISIRRRKKTAVQNSKCHRQLDIFVNEKQRIPSAHKDKKSLHFTGLKKIFFLCITPLKGPQQLRPWQSWSCFKSFSYSPKG